MSAELGIEAVPSVTEQAVHTYFFKTKISVSGVETSKEETLMLVKKKNPNIVREHFIKNKQVF